MTEKESYSDFIETGDKTDHPYYVLKNDEITDEQAIAVIRKASEFTAITPELEGIYRSKVAQGLSHKEACNSVLGELADFARPRA